MPTKQVRNRLLLFIAAVSALSLQACYNHSPYVKYYKQPWIHNTYGWGRLDMQYANEFVSRISLLASIKQISIIDEWKDGFRVNRSIQVNIRSTYDTANYIKKAKELNINSDSLFQLLDGFDKMGVNGFVKYGQYYIFPVVSSVFGFTVNGQGASERGYLYNLSLKDPLTDSSNGITIARKVEGHWYEYYSRLKFFSKISIDLQRFIAQP